ncbi:Site-specific recombinase XerD [Fictibacillus enclensis]|uniref:Integrase n=1 Tax=Fictibacillus enclensis TaxID=1017270 RepID=A0A0V8IUR7_9BACL|nr:site-specific integrase [Fictibacillus enclensis]KSU78471.1 integrase [Fictibacillus enclensis]SCC40871.1 Site-specific recombinase XerD [Fictibacillus enclensis]
MASFQKYTTKQGPMWLFKMDTGTNPETGKRQTTTRRGFKTKKEAQKAASTLELEISSGIWISTNNYTFDEVFNQWFTNHRKTIKASTQKTIQSKFKKHILPRFGKIKMKDVTKAYCQEMINEIAELIASVNDIKIQANQVFNYALKMDIISKNPMEHVSIPRKQREMISEDNDQTDRNYWRKDEIKNFLMITERELEFRDHVLFHLLIYTGARKGELLALTWDDINFGDGSIRLAKTLFQNEGGFVFQTPKTKESRRLISLDRNTLHLLKKWRTRQYEAILASGSNIVLNNVVFTRENGSPMRLAYLNEKLNIVIKKHQLHRITIHGLRHTHASLLFEAGASIKEVQERLGHTDIKMTMNIYTHVTDTLKEQTAEKFQRYIEL